MPEETITQSNGPPSSSDFTYPGPLIADSNGGVLAQVNVFRCLNWNWNCSESTWQTLVRRYADGSLADAREIPVAPDPNGGFFPASPIALTGDDGTAYIRDGSTLTARDVETWLPKWSVPSGGSVIALANGGVAVQDIVSGNVTAYDSTGSATGTDPIPLNGPSSTLQFENWQGSNPVTGSITTVRSVGLAPAAFSFESQQAKGNVHNQNAPRRFENPERGAEWLLGYFNIYSKVVNKEVGGLVCQQGTIIAWTLVEGNGDSVFTFSNPCPVNAAGVPMDTKASWHTHANNPGEGPSGGLRDANNPQACTLLIPTVSDLNNANQAWASGLTGAKFYMTTPSDRIYRYQGPVSQQNTQRRLGNQWVSFNPCTGQDQP
jgi:hypothetical protein